MKKIAFLGLGRMGFPMAGYIAAAGYDVVVYNRTAARATAWQKQYLGRVASTPYACAVGCDAVLCCLGNDDDVEAVLLGDKGALAAMPDKALLIDHTTTSARLARRLGTQAQKRGIDFVDAPLSGGEQGALDGKLAIMVGGTPAAFAKAKNIMQCYAARISHIGDIGHGQLAKMVNQICVVGVLQGLSEGIRFAESVGIDKENIFQAISQGAAASWQMQHRYQTMSQRQFDFGFKVDWMVKDLRYCLDEASAQNCPLPLTRWVHACYEQLQRDGHHASDTSSLVTVLDRD